MRKKKKKRKKKHQMKRFNNQLLLEKLYQKHQNQTLNITVLDASSTAVIMVKRQAVQLPSLIMKVMMELLHKCLKKKMKKKSMKNQTINQSNNKIMFLKLKKKNMKKKSTTLQITIQNKIMILKLKKRRKTSMKKLLNQRNKLHNHKFLILQVLLEEITLQVILVKQLLIKVKQVENQAISFQKVIKKSQLSEVLFKILNQDRESTFLLWKMKKMIMKQISMNQNCLIFHTKLIWLTI